MGGGDAGAVEAMVDEAGLRGLPLAELSARAGVRWDGRDDLVRDLTAAGRVVLLGESIYLSARLEAARECVLASVRAHHARHPLDEGVPREELRERLFSGAAPAFEHTIATLVQAGQIVARERVALRGHSLALTDEEARTRDAMVTMFERAALSPPDGADLLARVGAKKDLVDRIAGLLIRQKVLIRVGDLLFHESALRRLKDEVRALKGQHATERIDVGTFKDRYQVSRKYAIPLLEFLDRERITRRVGDARQIL
jgi:selenocysteine-specific elongation factor